MFNSETLKVRSRWCQIWVWAISPPFIANFQAMRPGYFCWVMNKPHLHPIGVGEMFFVGDERAKLGALTFRCFALSTCSFTRMAPNLLACFAHHMKRRLLRRSALSIKKFKAAVSGLKRLAKSDSHFKCTRGKFSSNVEIAWGDFHASAKACTLTAVCNIHRTLNRCLANCCLTS